MQAGSPKTAIELLEKGANPFQRAFVTTGKLRRPKRSAKYRYSSEISVNGISPIFAPLVQNSSPYLEYSSVSSEKKSDEDEEIYPFNVDLLNKVFSCTISPVVDAIPASQCFPEIVLQEIMTIICEETNFKSQSLIKTTFGPIDLATLVFGKQSAGLQQMCIRVIMYSVFFTQCAKKSLEFIAKLNGKTIISEEEMNKRVENFGSCENWDNEDTKNSNNDNQQTENSEEKVENHGNLDNADSNNQETDISEENIKERTENPGNCNNGDTENSGNDSQEIEHSEEKMDKRMENPGNWSNGDTKSSNNNNNEETESSEGKNSEKMEDTETDIDSDDREFIVVEDLNNISQWNVVMELDRT
ncbi:hypothetical protein L9F63_016940, partial [Diploptera punctata]